MAPVGAGPLLGPPYQLAYVTASLGDALEAMADLGATAFERRDDVVLRTESGTSATISMALAWVGSTMFELIEPRGGDDTVFRDALGPEMGGLRFHHLCVRLATLTELDAVRARLEASRVPILFPSTPDDDRLRFFYADLRPTLGHLVEYLHLSPARLAMHRGLPWNPPLGPHDEDSARVRGSATP